MGGYGTFDALERYPKLFAAAVPVCGGGDLSKASSIAHIPIWIFHGAEDPAVNVAFSFEMYRSTDPGRSASRFNHLSRNGPFFVDCRI